jgi:hypothetical protein
MATAHKVMVTVKNSKGQIKTLPFTTADTNTTAILSPSGEDAVVLSQNDCWIVDYVHSTQGSTTQVYVYFNDVRTGDVIFTAASQPNVNRQVPNCPLYVPAGTRVQFRTIT